MKKIKVMFSIVVISVLLFACGSSNLHDSSTEDAAKFDDLKEKISSCDSLIDTSYSDIYNLGSYTCNYIDSCQKLNFSATQYSILKAMYSWLEKETGATSSDVEQLYSDIQNSYDDISSYDISSPESDSLKDAFKNKYTAYVKFYGFITSPNVTDLTTYTEYYNSYVKDFTDSDSELNIEL